MILKFICIWIHHPQCGLDWTGVTDWWGGRISPEGLTLAAAAIVKTPEMFAQLPKRLPTALCFHVQHLDIRLQGKAIILLQECQHAGMVPCPAQLVLACRRELALKSQRE